MTYHSDVLLSKIDVSRAFRNLCTDLSDFDLLGLSWGGKSYIDISIPMGMKPDPLYVSISSDIL